MKKEKTFRLRCVVCFTRDERSLSECTGNDSPICKYCFGPMVVDTVFDLQTPPRPLPPEGLVM